MRLKWSNIPIPEAHITGLIAGFLINFLYPLGVNFPQGLRHILGWPAIGIGVFLAGWAVITVADMDVASPTGIITNGPYAFSRNPMYVGWTMISLGIALILNNIWIFLFLIVTVFYTHKFVILKEEHSLEGQFGEQYQKYKQDVRRYL